MAVDASRGAYSAAAAVAAVVEQDQLEVLRMDLHPSSAQLPPAMGLGLADWDALVLEASRAQVGNGIRRKADQEVAAPAPELRSQTAGLRVQVREEEEEEVVVLVLNDIAEVLSEERLIHFHDARPCCYGDGLPRIHVVGERGSCPGARCLETACAYDRVRERFVEMFPG